MVQSTGHWQAWLRWCCGMLFVLGAAAPAAATIKELSNDSFAGAGTLTCVLGFLEAESAAAKLTANPGDYPYEIKKVRMLICPEPTSGFVILRIYEDNTGTVVPGPLLYEEIVQVTASDIALNEVDLSLQGIVISSGSVRVEFEWYQASPPGPGLARDIDGFTPFVNFIYVNPPGVWVYANDAGVMGDWIIRMEIETDAEAPIFADGFESGNTTEWTTTLP
jgi:hypothetical protein